MSPRAGAWDPSVWRTMHWLLSFVQPLPHRRSVAPSSLLLSSSPLASPPSPLPLDTWRWNITCEDISLRRIIRFVRQSRGRFRILKTRYETLRRPEVCARRFSHVGHRRPRLPFPSLFPPWCILEREHPESHVKMQRCTALEFHRDELLHDLVPEASAFSFS